MISFIGWNSKARRESTQSQYAAASHQHTVVDPRDSISSFPIFSHVSLHKKPPSTTSHFLGTLEHLTQVSVA